MQFSDDKKVEILIAGLQERYSSIHHIRDRVYNVGIWFLGLTLAAAGWFFQKQITLSCQQKSFAILAVLIAFAALIYYLRDQRRGFCSQMKAVVKIERALGFYEPGFFDVQGDPLYEPSWERAGTKKKQGKFFLTTYLLLCVGTAFLLLSIIYMPIKKDEALSPLIIPQDSFVAPGAEL